MDHKGEVGTIDIVAKHLEWANETVGKKLSAVRAEVFRLEGKLARNPLKLELDFGVESVVLRCASDGATLSVTSDPLASADMDESGEILVADWSGRRPFARVLGRVLDDVQAIYDRSDRTVIGVMLRFGDEQLDIVNLGDELVPRPAIDEALLEGASRVSLRKLSH
jgi:hypothetical protein